MLRSWDNELVELDELDSSLEKKSKLSDIHHFNLLYHSQNQLAQQHLTLAYHLSIISNKIKDIIKHNNQLLNNNFL